jgi:hypothetical protein
MYRALLTEEEELRDWFYKGMLRQERAALEEWEKKGGLPDYLKEDLENLKKAGY